MRLSRSVLKKQKSHHSLTAILSNKSTLFLFVDRVYRHTFAILLRVVTVRSPRRNRHMHKGICTYSPKRRVRSIPTEAVSEPSGQRFLEIDCEGRILCVCNRARISLQKAVGMPLYYGVNETVYIWQANITVCRYCLQAERRYWITKSAHSSLKNRKFVAGILSVTILLFYGQYGLLFCNICYLFY